MRPRPALCESATSAVPARASAASSSAVFVEAVPGGKAYVIARRGGAEEVKVKHRITRLW